MAKGSKRRAKVIRAMVAFIVVLALLTFFSNTIMNLTIPKVMGAYASRGNLSFSNNARGTVTVENKTDIKGLDSRVVDQVKVGNYDQVKKGDTILTLKPIEESADLDAKRTQLKELLRAQEYDSRVSDDTDFSTYYDSINAAKETLSAAQNTLDSVRNRSSVEAENRAIINDESAKAVSLEASVTAAAKTVEDINKDIAAIDAQITPLQSQIDVYIALGTPTPTPVPSEPATVPDGVTPTPTPVPDLDADGFDKNSPTYEMDKLMAKIKDLEAQKSILKSQLDDAQARLNEASAELSECQSKITDAQATIKSLENLPTEQAAINAVNAAEHAVTAAQKALADAQTQAGITRDKNQDTAEDRAEQIAKLEEEIDKLEKAAKITEIKAPADGYVYNVTVSSGDTLNAKDTIASILPETDRVCSVTFEFTTTAAQNIYVGMPLEVTSGFIDGCTVASIKPDPNNPRGNRLVKCIVDGSDAWPGEEITVNAGRGNDNYKCVVPSSAVNQDTNGDFVYVIQGSSTPLGDKYTVKKLYVSVEAEDGVSKAIKGEGLDKYDVMIVIRAEKPLEDGQRVRLEDYSSK